MKRMLFVCVLCLCPMVSWAQESAKAPDMRGMVIDTAFEQYVSPKLFEECLQGLSPSLLTDVALQLAEGERVLHRSCEGVTADQMARFAAEIAQQRGDTASLDRLIKSARERKADDLAVEIGTLAALGGASRSEDKITAVLKEMDPKDAERCKEILFFFDGEKFFYSKEELKNVLPLVDSMMDVSDVTKAKLRAALAQEIEAAQENADPAALALVALSAPSRSSWITINNRRWYYPMTFSGPSAYQDAWSYVHKGGGRFPYLNEFQNNNATLRANGYGKNSILNVYWTEENESFQWSIAFGRVHNNGRNYRGYDEAIRVTW